MIKLEGETMTATETKSVVTCDLEGRIETFNAGAESIFGYAADEVVGKKRVSLFSPGLVVLGHVGHWLSEARDKGSFETTTVFVRKDGTRFAAEITIRPTRRDGEHIGYCGITVPRPDLSPEEASPPAKLGTRIFSWLVVARAPFLTATLVPVLVGAGLVASGQPGPFPWALFALTLVGAFALQVAANTFNDYFDWRSGTDEGNNDYFMPFSGGSRSIELRLVTPRRLLFVAWTATLLSASTGVVLVTHAGWGILLFGLVGALSAYFYTAPPLRLAARKGLGELVVGLNFGPLMVAGTVYALVGHVTWVHFFAGLPVGLLTTAILWVNEFPDAESDERAGKLNLVVVLGTRAARWGYLALVAGAALLVVSGVVTQTLPVGALLFLLAAPLGVFATVVLFRHYGSRRLVRANAATIQLHLLSGLCLALGLCL